MKIYIHVDDSTVDGFTSAFPPLNIPSIITSLKTELPIATKLRAVEDVDPSVDISDWWQRHEQELHIIGAQPLSKCF